MQRLASAGLLLAAFAFPFAAGAQSPSPPAGQATQRTETKPFNPHANHPAPAKAAPAKPWHDSSALPMPILADALQDAGCDNADVLDHCRSDGPHVRGCWVVDLVLGKA